MTRALRWLLAAFLVVLTLVYVSAVVSVLPTWAVVLAGLLWSWLLSVLLRRRRGSSFAGQYREAPVVQGH